MFSAPLAMSEFSRYMVNAYDDREMRGIPVGFQAFFGALETGSKTIFSPDANVIDIDIVRGNDKIAALVPRGGISRHLGSLNKDMNEGKFTSFARSYPLSIESGEITSDQLNYRVAGEAAYSNTTKAQRMRILARSIHNESIRRTGRTFEVLAAQSVLSGKQDAILGTTNAALQFDFMRKSTHIWTALNLWLSGSQTILADLDTSCVLADRDAALPPDMAILGDLAMDAFLKDTNIKATADNKGFDVIAISDRLPLPPKFARFVNAGFICRGRVRTPGGYELYLFTYQGGYTNSSNVFVPFMPQKKVLICSSQARCDRYFGPAEMLPPTSAKLAWYQERFGFNMANPALPVNPRDPGMIIDPRMFYCDAYETTDNQKIIITTQSAPIFATTATDAFVTMTVLS